MKVAGIILAAGRSRRMGFPKSLLDINGRAAIAVLLESLMGASSADAIVVVTHSGDASTLEDLVRACPRGPVRVVVNPDPEAGRTGSVQLGLASLTAWACELETEFDGAWICSVDTPCVNPATLNVLLRSFEDLGRSARIIPTTLESHPSGDVSRRRGGHPILIGRDWWTQIEGLGTDQPLRDLFAFDPGDVERVEVDDPAILWNLNTPSDVERFLGRPALRATTP